MSTSNRASHCKNMELNKFLKKLLKQDSKSKANRAREARRSEIESLGMDLVERNRWVDGKYVPKSYDLYRDGSIIAGPFESSLEALEEARRLSREHLSRG